jgi:hypothetical protein
MNPMTRRSFLEKAGVVTTVASGSLAAVTGSEVAESGVGARREVDAAEGYTRYAMARCVAESTFTSGKAYTDPFNEIELDVIFTDPQGQEHRMPAFWAGGQAWRVRYSPPTAGRYAFRTISTDTSNPDLHNQKGELIVSEYTGGNPLRKHGPVRVAADQRHFEHEDKTPFFWLGDTWWMGLCHRLRWPEDFQKLVADRVNKGFTVIQIIAGLYPDMPPFDPRGANEAGYPWEENYVRINPRYFDMADLRIQELVERGLVPCVVGCWGYFLGFMGLPKVKQHWRNIVARWGAYPVVWCLAGEGAMPYYLSTDFKEFASGHKTESSSRQIAGWTEVARFVRSIDPYHHPITIHPSSTARESVEDPAVLDFDMLQTGHGDRASYPNTINKVTGELSVSPKMPVLVGEVCYEGILDASRQEVSRFVFWACMLSGAAGHTYGADGIWQVNTAEHPYGPSPHGRSWGGPPWDEAAELPGSQQVGIGRGLLKRYEWWRLEPHPEWVDPHWSKENYQLPYAAGIPGKLRIIFVPPMWDAPKVKNVEFGVSYRAFFFDPRTGKEQPVGDVTAEADGTWQSPVQPTFEQWVIVLENRT